jgi:hypothetical protein
VLSLLVRTLAQRASHAGDEASRAERDAHRDPEQSSQWCGSGDVVEEESEDQSTDDGTREKASQTEKVPAA